MDINWLIDFVCLGRTLNFSRAAEERNVTQSAFSRRIRSLESWVGTTLVDRSSYPVQLTPAGRQFLSTAQVTLAQLTDARQAIRAAERNKLPLQRIAALHAISVNFLQPRLTEFAKTMPDLRTRVVSDTMAACCQLLTDGGCEFLLYYRHQHVEPILDETRFARKDICTEDLIPVAQQAAALRHGWTLGGPSRTSVPYLSYDPDTFLGSVVDRTIGQRQTPLDIRYMDALAEALKRQAVAGAGVAWLPAFSIAEELADGRLVRMGGPSWTARLTISLFCSPDRLDKVGRALWDAF
ncbi:LysR substrate-binding domain-containing protein [Roseicyclus persicicus]|uniref:LysR family transcriptional regulator n=1 Tax=Roseicyclus persicicus TaxID=2650661 RepID=A0A7X6H241_9RHOB|nr:LysR family transcriptional regulator [Roseibacterium persicicum]